MNNAAVNLEILEKLAERLCPEGQEVVIKRDSDRFAYCWQMPNQEAIGMAIADVRAWLEEGQWFCIQFAGHYFRSDNSSTIAYLIRALSRQ